MSGGNKMSINSISVESQQKPENSIENNETTDKKPLMASKLSNASTKELTTKTTKTNPFYYNYENRNQSSKRVISDEQREDNLEINPLLKRIKKDNNNLLIDNKTFLKREISNELYFNSSQPILKLFSQLSLTKTTSSALPTSSSTALTIKSDLSEPKPIVNDLHLCKDITEDLEQLKINDCNCNKCGNDLNANNLKVLKVKKKKSKKSRKKLKKMCKKFKKTKFFDNKSINSNNESNVNKFVSNVVKELKISFTESLTEEEINELFALKDEGIVLKARKRGKGVLRRYKCLLCRRNLSDVSLISGHISSDDHLMAKREQKFTHIDSLFAIDIGSYTDIEVLLARKQQLRKITFKTKQQLYNHGIRLKDAFGSNAFVCIKCSLTFESLPDAINHFEFSQIIEQNITQQKAMDSTEEQHISDNISLFESEGIVRKSYKNPKKRNKKNSYYCVYCKIFIGNEKSAFEHLNRSNHKRTKREQPLGPN